MTKMSTIAKLAGVVICSTHEMLQSHLNACIGLTHQHTSELSNVLAETTNLQTYTALQIQPSMPYTCPSSREED